MNTLVLRNKPRKGTNGDTYLIEVIGDSPAKEAIRESIKALEYHPAKASRRCLIDMLGLIEKHNFQICYTEHYFDDNEMENWLFVLQG